MRVAIVYASLSGNTEEVAEALRDALSRSATVEMIRATDVTDRTMLDHDHVYFGSYTWGDGKLPAEMRKALRYILKGTSCPFRHASVFGTGDKQFVNYCRAVDEIAYHLEAHGRQLVLPHLKIEQSPRNRLPDVQDWGDASIAFMERHVIRNTERGSTLCHSLV